MNIRERLQIRALINLIISIIERLVSIFERLSPKKEIDTPNIEPKPNRPRPLKRVIDTIDNIIPVPWRKK